MKKMTEIEKAIEAIERELDYVTNHISVKDRDKNEHLKGMKAAYKIALEILENKGEDIEFGGNE